MRFEIPVSEIVWRFSPSGGPGGQHANKVSTRVDLSFDVTASGQFNDEERSRIVAKLGDEVRIREDGSRSQATNRKRAVRRLNAMLEDAVRPDPPQRRATRPSKGARQRRLDAKRARSRSKVNRKKPNIDD